MHKKHHQQNPAMESFEPYSDQRLTELAGQWINNRLSSVRIVMGPLHIVGEFDIYNSLIRFTATEAGQVIAASLQWYDTRFVVFRCLYGYLRLHGVLNWEWEMPNEYIDFDMLLYHGIVTPYLPHLRVRYPRQLEHSLYVENLWANSYMKIVPTFHPTRSYPVYPSGETTAWVDSVLNSDPEFNNDIIFDLPGTSIAQVLQG